MDNKPLVSIIIPVYNAESTIADCLESLISQTYDKNEIIIVDDGSKDKTAGIVEKYQHKVSYYYQDHSGGPAIPRNIGILHSSGEYLCFFDSDDVMNSDYISKQVDFLQRYPDVGMVFCDYKNFDENGYWKTSHFQESPQIWNIINNDNDKKEFILNNACRILAKQNFGIMGTLMIRRTMLKYEKGFNQNLKASVDFFFYYQLARYSQVGIINYIGMLRRLHTNNITFNKYKVLTMGIHSRTLLLESETDTQAKALLNEYIASHYSSLSRYEANHGKYYQSFVCEFKALSNNLCFVQLIKSLKSFFRTILMAIGIHNPQEP